MDTRIAEMIATLKASGYTDRVVDEHWGRNWRDKRWYGFEGTSDTIFQVVSGNVYTRVLAVGADEPLLCMQYESASHPARPKTDFYCDQSPTAASKDLREVLGMILGLKTLEAREAA